MHLSMRRGIIAVVNIEVAGSTGNSSSPHDPFEHSCSQNQITDPSVHLHAFQSKIVFGLADLHEQGLMGIGAVSKCEKSPPKTTK